MPLRHPIVVIVSALSVLASAQTKYAMTVLDSQNENVVTDLNNLGYAATTRLMSLNGIYQQVLGPGSVFTPAFSNLGVTGAKINDLSTIAIDVTVGGLRRAALKRLDGTVTLLPGTPEGQSSYVRRINNQNQAVGIAGNQLAFWDADGSYTNLGSDGLSVAIGDNGNVAIRRSNDFSIRKSDGSTVNLPAGATLFDQYAYETEGSLQNKIVANDRGEFLGRYQDSVGYWDSAVGWHSLGFDLAGDFEGYTIFGFNDSHQIVMRNLNSEIRVRDESGDLVSVIPNILNPQFQIQYGAILSGINNLGQIYSGVPDYNGPTRYRAMVLTPVPEPQALALVGLSALVLVRRRARSVKAAL